MAMLKNKLNPVEEIYETNKKSDRSLLNEEPNPSKSRRVQKINNFVKNQEFQCTEELVIKKNTTETAKTKVIEKPTMLIRKPFQRQSPHQIKDAVVDNREIIRKF